MFGSSFNRGNSVHITVNIYVDNNNNNNNHLFPICVQLSWFFIAFIYSCTGKTLIPEPCGYIQVELGILSER